MAVTGSLQTKDYQHFQVIDDNGTVVATFEGANIAKGCLPGDSVEWTPESRSLKQLERDTYPLLVGTLELASRTTYGLTSSNHNIYLFVPYTRGFPPFHVGSSHKDRSCHQIAFVKFHSWDATKSQCPRGHLERLLGPAGDLKAEELALQWLAHPWPSLRGKAVPTPSLVVGEAEVARQNVRGFTFNIDPAGCRDIDDVISLERVKDGWVCTITIADVAAYVEEMGAIDILASTIGQTLYKDGEAIYPMLPTSLSEEACTLKAGEERRGVSLEFFWNETTNTVNGVRWFESLFTNQQTFTYEEFQASDSLERTALQCIATCLEKSPVPITDSHTWIEAMMKFYNITAGAQLKQCGAGILRKHSAPDSARFEAYVSLDPELGRLAQSSAEYCLAEEEGVSHFGLGAAAYCHATSPIRRYADLMNQRILKQLIRGNKEGLFVTVPVADLNLRAKAAKTFEKNLHYLRALLEGPKEVEGLILEVSDSKIRLWIPSWQKIVSIRPEPDRILAVGQTARIRFAIHLLGRHWKERIITKIMLDQ